MPRGGDRPAARARFSQSRDAAVSRLRSTASPCTGDSPSPAWYTTWTAVTPRARRTASKAAGTWSPSGPDGAWYTTAVAPGAGPGEPAALGWKAKGGGAVRPPGGKGLAAAAPAPPTDARAPAEGTAAVAFFAPAAASAAGAPAAPPAPGVGTAPDASAAEEPPWPPACCAAPFCLAATDWREDRPPPPGRTSVPTVATRRTTAAATATATATGRRPPAEGM